MLLSPARSPGASAPLVQDIWYQAYQSGRDRFASADWRQATVYLNRSITLKKEPELAAETVGIISVDYLPYFYLGIAHYNLGDLAAAESALATSLQYAAIERYSRGGDVRKYLNIIRQARNDRRILDSLQNDVSARDKSAGARPLPESALNTLFTLAAQKNHGYAKLFLDSLGSAHPGSQIVTSVSHILRDLESIPKAAPDSFSSWFRSGLSNYLSGDLATALRSFERASGHEGAPNQVENWIRHVESEMTAQDMIRRPDPETIVELDTVSSAPFALLTSPTETRRIPYLLSGTVSDDLGIAFIEFALNGAPLEDTRGTRRQIKPGPEDDPRGFSFALPVTLPVGENRIVITAHDIDPDRHASSFRFTVTRRLPLFKTGTFWFSVGGALLLIAAIFATRSRMRNRLAFVSKYNPYIAGAPIRNRELFFGREQVIKRILNTLHHNSLLLLGPRRIGKTSLQHQLTVRLGEARDPDYHFVPVFIDLQGTREERLFATMMRDIRDGLDSLNLDLHSLRIQNADNAYAARDFSADIKHVLRALGATSSRKLKLVLQIDEVDQLNGYSARVNQKLRGIFMKTFAENLVAVMSGTQIDRQWESEGSPWYNFFEEIHIDVLEDDAAVQLVRNPVRGIFQFEDRAVEELISLAGANPYRIQRLCMNVINRIIENRRRNVTLADVQTVYAQVFPQATL